MSSMSEITSEDNLHNSAVKKEKVYDKKYKPLYKAVRHGKLEEVITFLKAHPEGVNAIISEIQQTALHIAVTFEHLHIVEELVNMKEMEKQVLEWKDQVGYTAFAIAASTGMIEMAKCMIKKNTNLPMIPSNFGTLPVTMAVINNRKEMARYLYSVTPLEKLEPEQKASLLNQCFIAKSLDLALDLLQRYPSLAVIPYNKDRIFVNGLAATASMFPSGCNLQFWQRWIYDWIQIKSATTIKDIQLNIERSNARENDDKMTKIPNKHRGLQHRLVEYIFNLTGLKRIYKLKLTHVMSRKILLITCNEIATSDDLSALKDDHGEFKPLFTAAKYGNAEFIIELLKVNNDLLENINKDGRNFFLHAIQYRQAKVFNLIYGVHSTIAYGLANTNDKSHNTALHMAALLAPSTELNRISGAALQMQRELQWFKEVENIMTGKRDSVNKDEKIARDLFTENHKDLRKDGERWIKDNATSCTIVAAFIVTIMFAVSFTVPGGNDQNGYPMFRHHKLFKLFIIADAISLFSSTTSVLMFLGILTSRYAEDDFLISLPTKLIIGLSMMFISLAAMMISFSAAIAVMLPGKLWIIIPVILFACVPVSLFVWLQFPLLVEIFLSTYGRGIFERNRERWF